MTGARAKVERTVRRWSDCTKCGLCESRRRVVFWRGNEIARLAVVGEAPGAVEDEDPRGQPFLGEAGELFDELCESVMGPEPWDMFVCNTVGCRPPGNRKPRPEEFRACAPRLYSMLAAVRPKALLLLGASPLEFLTPQRRITEWRGREVRVSFPWKGGTLEFPAVPTLHPGFLLRTRDKRLERTVAADIRQAWELAAGGSYLEGD